MKISFHDNADDSLFKFAVIIAEYRGKWVYCKHKDRNTYEVPGGHREQGESILQTAERELYEETGAVRYRIRPVCAYSVKNSEETFGMLYYAEIDEFSELAFEIEKIELFDNLPENLTYPHIQPSLFYRTKKVIKGSSFSYVLWDWNGTLADDARVALSSVNDMLIKRNMPPIDKDFYLHNCTTPIIDFYRKIFDFDKIPFEDLLKEFGEGYHAHINESGLMPGARDVLEDLKKQGVSQIIISSSAQKELLTFAERFKVKDYFSNILGAENYYSESKKERAASFISESRIDPKEVIVIGDTIHDYETANAINAECILIANGHQSKEKLLRCGKIVLDDITEAGLYV
jgi:phosphoglycolate phosphatase-like HAD superfamily hydrolase/8-oxo-dGTP pyrophosphatase MutT (NUDIX family)